MLVYIISPLSAENNTGELIRDDMKASMHDTTSDPVSHFGYIQFLHVRVWKV
jgi:hypothetical protein